MSDLSVNDAAPNSAYRDVYDKLTQASFATIMAQDDKIGLVDAVDEEFAEDMSEARRLINKWRIKFKEAGLIE